MNEIVELRQYTLHPGKRDVLIELFDREFIEPQEAVGMTILGQFRDLDDPDRFVWLRGFSDMATRAHALGSFYGGPTWKAHRDVANASMIDSSDVLLLRPARPGSGFTDTIRHRPPPGATQVPPGLVVATIYPLAQSVDTVDFTDFFERVLARLLVETGAAIAARFVTESSANTFPALPVREDARVFVWFSRFLDQAAYERHLDARSKRWSGEAADGLAARLAAPPQVLRLSPTARSAG